MPSTASRSRTADESPDVGKGPLGPPPALPPVASPSESPKQPKLKFQGCGQASFYGAEFEGKQTASGEVFEPGLFTAAHRTLPFGTRLRVVLKTEPPEAGLSSSRTVDVRINDHGPALRDRMIDLSEAAFAKLAPVGTGVIGVCLYKIL